uniref:Uncharacterized protein n=1 Tax=uncultured Thiotrichaceae bacterium TaxID=298394 RepID=A0A6S6TYY7_9GAMM|nr:MAG: Unknown protein [uncultured Thiotrichaceae bacterium]
MIPRFTSFKLTVTTCFIIIACQTSVAQAGFFDDFLSVFKAPAATPAPATTPVPAATPALVDQQPLQAGQDQTEATVQVENKPPPGPTQKDLNEMLWLAALQGNDGRIRGLVEQGASPASGTPHGETPLHVAASRGHLKPIIYLANHGGSVNARTNNGWTPLHHAARFGHMQAVKYLLHMGAIPHIRTTDKGQKSPMEMAVDNGYFEIAALFGYRPK